MKTNRFWLCLFAGLIVLSALAAVYVTGRALPGARAAVYQEGRLLYTIELDRDFEPYTLAISGAVENILAVEPGRIRVVSATCPDRLCVHQGWLSEGLVPIVCLPNGLVIRLEGGDGGIDAISQ